MNQRSQIVPLQGGLDLVTPAMSKVPGTLIGADNYEAEARGYRRCAGYERFDGRPAPSAASYKVFVTYAGKAAINDGDVVTGNTSGATGVAVVDHVVTSGSYAAGDARGRLTLHAISGNFIADEFVRVGISDPLNDKMRLADTGTVNGAVDDASHTAHIAEITAYRRALIGQVPGQGPVRGVATYKGDVYAWRDNVGVTAGGMHKSTPSGWQTQTFGHRIPFDEGVIAFAEGETVVGGTSGATGIVRRVVRQRGGWNSMLAAVDQAQGYIVISGLTGSFNSSELLKVGGTTKAKAVSGQIAVTLPVGSTIVPQVHNFYATEGFERLYFATTTGTAFEWDGTTLVPIYSGMPLSLDRPQQLSVYADSLWLGYNGGSLQGSTPGDPLNWDGSLGAVEVGFGEDITALEGGILNSMIVAGRSKIGYIVGTNASNYELRPISPSSGAIPGSMQVVGRPLYLDDLGVRSLDAAEAYGDWNMGTMTQLVEPLLRSKREAGVLPAGSLRVRGKDQYRIYFKDQTYLIIYMGRKNPEVMPARLGFVASSFTSGEDSQGGEVLYAGSDDGRVYQLDRGTSFDGGDIEAYLRLSFLHQGAPNLMKRYHRARIEGTASELNTLLRIAGDFSYGDPEQASISETEMLFYGSGGFWGSANWNEFYWSAAIEGQAWAELNGIGENVSLVIASVSAVETTHSLSTITINWTPRRSAR